MFSQGSFKYIGAEVNISTASVAAVSVISCAKRQVKIMDQHCPVCRF